MTHRKCKYLLIISRLVLALLAIIPANVLTVLSVQASMVLPSKALSQYPAHAVEIDEQQIATTIAVGNAHTCTVINNGGVKCWGANYARQLGDGTSINRPTPIDVQGLGSAVKVIAASYNRTCAITINGGVKCWGSYLTAPTDISGLTTGIIAITLGERHGCVITNVGAVKCWGLNNVGQLGDGTTTSSAEPVDVSGLSSGVKAISAGGNHTCALTSSNGIKCWGDNSSGQLGNNTTNPQFIPVDVSGLNSGVVAISAGTGNTCIDYCYDIYHTCAITNNGGAKCWGANGSGQLGDGTSIRRLTPVDVEGLTDGVNVITAGDGYTCAITIATKTKCWGANHSGQLGISTAFNSRLLPADVTGLIYGLTTVAASNAHTCGITNKGGVKCWGLNGFGQLGNGTTTDRSLPVDSSELTSEIVSITGGNRHTCGLTNAGGAKCWGYNSERQLGDGLTDSRFIPQYVSGLTSNVTAIAAGPTHNCVLTNIGSVKCWGSNSKGQLGDGTTNNHATPIDVNGLASGVIAIGVGDEYSCALTSANGVKCWGSNGFGQLGDGTTTNSYIPINVIGLPEGASTIKVGYRHTCVLTINSSLKCWGNNHIGQLGDGTTTNRNTPVNVIGLNTGVFSFAIGAAFTCAIISGGAVKCWGSNNGGQLGNGTKIDQYTPQDVIGLSSGAANIATGGKHTCALLVNGNAKCWGENSSGELGDGTTINRYTPVDVNGLSGGVTAITTGGAHTCALVNSKVKCWGHNIFGQLGANPGWIPTSVVGFEDPILLQKIYLPIMQR